MKLNDKLQNNDLYPFHMPGHKRNKNFNIPASEIDITEIDGFDNLHSPTDLLDDMQKEISTLIFGGSLLNLQKCSIFKAFRCKKKHNKC